MPVGVAGLLGLLTGQAEAGFLTPPGASQVIVGAGVSRFSRQFDSRGRLRRAGSFAKTSLDAYASHGLNDRITLIAALTVERLERQGRGAGDAHAWQALFGPRVALWRNEATTVSVQALAGLGRDDTARRGRLVGAMADARLLVGHGFSWGDWPAFVEWQAGYRWAAPGARDEVRLDVTVGVSPHPDWQVLVQAFAAHAPARGRTRAHSHRLKLQGALVRRLGQDWRAQLSLFTTPFGVNAAAETGAVLALWRLF